MNLYIYIGLFASIFGLTTQIPQIYKIIRTKSSIDLSYGTITIYITNQICWFIYAMYIQDNIYAINAAGHFIIGCIELSLKTYYDKIRNNIDTPE